MHKNFLFGKLKELVDHALANQVETGFASAESLSKQIHSLAQQAVSKRPEIDPVDAKMGALFSIVMSLHTLSFIQSMYLTRMIEYISETLNPEQWEEVLNKVKRLNIEEVSWPKEFGSPLPL